MFELPEIANFAKQFNETLKGKKIKESSLGNKPHKFVWYNRTHKEFAKLTKGKKIGQTYSKGKWLFIPLEPGYVLLFGEGGGKLLYNPPSTKMPKTYHLYLFFTDDSFLTFITQMWGAMELYKKGEEQKRQYVKDMRLTPIDKKFTFEYFSNLIDSLIEEKKRSVKGLLTQDQLIPGLGNAIAQDILFKARLNPKFPISKLDKNKRKKLYREIISTVDEVIKMGGRYDEVDLHGNSGGYVRILDKNALGKPCPACGSKIERIQYLGGMCYFCPACQPTVKS
jgi:formamidopyrimidine-DNA glycosylase